MSWSAPLPLIRIETKIAAAMTTAEYVLDSMPKAVPDKMLVAAPVSDAALTSRTGAKWVDV